MLDFTMACMAVVGFITLSASFIEVATGKIGNVTRVGEEGHNPPADIEQGGDS